MGISCVIVALAPYYNEIRPHRSLNNDVPHSRAIQHSAAGIVRSGRATSRWIHEGPPEDW